MACMLADWLAFWLTLLLTGHLCFKQAQPKICHSPKVDDGVEIFFKTS